MNIDEILREYDAMYGRNTLEEIEDFLVEKVTEAGKESDAGSLFTLLNEAVGFFRDTTQKEKALKCCDELLALMEKMGLGAGYEYATALLNIANAYRAFGLFEESLTFFETTLQIYIAKVPEGNFAYANLYNNWSLLYQEMEDYAKAAEMLEKALEIVNAHEDAVIQQATTHTNLAATLLQMVRTGTEECYEAAVEHLRAALDIFEADGCRDFHYGAALVAMGDAHSVKKEYAKAAKFYAAGLKELEKHVGKTDNYARVLEKYNYVKGLSEKKFSGDAGEWKSNLERSREFYEQYGAPMIHNFFPEYEERIAVGLVGEGSDCYGFDDEISADHDYEVGFCMWLTDEDFEKIGNRLQDAYAALIAKTDAALGEGGKNRFLSERRGVFSISGFYQGLLGTAEVCWQESHIPYQMVQEFQLAAATNGTVFRDDLGQFSQVREKLLAYYPEKVWFEKLAGALHEYAQYAQSNYARMMARKDLITAHLCVAKAVEAAMDLLYLLQRRYAPYYKWKRKGLEQSLTVNSYHTESAVNPYYAQVTSSSAANAGDEASVRKSCKTMEEILILLDKIVALPPQTHAWDNEVYNSAAINMRDECVRLFEQVAELILREMKCRKLADGEDVFLENYVGWMLARAEEGAKREGAKREGEKREGEKKESMKKESMKTDLVEKIVQLEWEQFDKVKNEGGRADCQDNFPTFSIMRKSQYLAWPEELLNSYCNDLLEAKNTGWNLIMEKYARMMKSTAPAKYAELEKELPVRSPERIAIAEEIIRIQVTWMEEFAKKYPKMAGNARSIHTEEDNEYNTSYETYLRGEMGTYSENTFVLYGKFVAQLAQAGRNLAYEIMENTALLYGYESVEDAESKL